MLFEITITENITRTTSPEPDGTPGYLALNKIGVYHQVVESIDIAAIAKIVNNL